MINNQPHTGALFRKGRYFSTSTGLQYLIEQKNYFYIFKFLIEIVHKLGNYSCPCSVLKKIIKK